MTGIVWLSVVLFAYVTEATPIEVSTGSNYLLASRRQPPKATSGSTDGCINFFNESWVCFQTGEQVLEASFDEHVDMIEPDVEVGINACQQPSPWHLHYITNEKQRNTDVPQQFRFSTPQPDHLVYVLDTWLDIEHPEFEGRASRGKAFTDGTENMHGTHVGALIAGKTVGVNRQAEVVSVQVLDSGGRGSWSTILRGLEWIVKQPRRGIINISIGGPRSEIVNKAVNLAVRNGWQVVVAAGNEHADACQASPASAELALTVGASTSDDQVADFSNYGRCVDLVAPGQDILSAVPNGLYAYMSGTSMASPIVAGLWSTQPSWLAGSDVLNRTLLGLVTGLPRGQPNRFAFLPPPAVNDCLTPLLIQNGKCATAL